MAKQKVERNFSHNGRKLFYVASEPDRAGNYKQFTQQEVESNPDQFEVMESNQRRSIVAEFTPLAEDDQQSLRATKTALRSRNIAPTGDGGLWRRDGKKPVSVLLASDGSWKCCNASGADHTTLESHLDSAHGSAGAQGSESDSGRLQRAFEQFLPPDEAALAARGPTPDGSEFDVQLRGKALLDRMDLLELE